MLEPTPVSTSAAWVDRLVDRLVLLDRLVDRLVLLHECYEQAFAHLGLADPPAARTAAARSGPERAPATAAGPRRPRPDPPVVRWAGCGHHER